MDILHQVVTEARARRQRGETGDGGTRVDGWRADLQPRAAVRAVTIPALERERDSLRARLAEVRFSFIHASPPLLRLPVSGHLLNPCAQTLHFADLYANVDGEGEYGTLPGGAGERGGTRAGRC